MPDVAKEDWPRQKELPQDSLAPRERRDSRAALIAQEAKTGTWSGLNRPSVVVGVGLFEESGRAANLMNASTGRFDTFSGDRVSPDFALIGIFVPTTVFDRLKHFLGHGHGPGTG